jgi:predicted glycosyltransferase
MSLIGPELPARDVRDLVAIGGKADLTQIFEFRQF